MKYNIENVTKEDVAIATKIKVTLGELRSTHDLVKIIENEAFVSDDPTWSKVCMFSYAYKLGQIQGKREERARRKANNAAKYAELENEFHKLLKTLKDKTISGGLNGPTI